MKMAYKRFTKFLLKINYDSKNTLKHIKTLITGELQYIGMYSLRKEMYIYVQLKKNVQIAENIISGNFKKLGIIYGPHSFFYIEDGLNMIKEEGYLVSRGPKRKFKPEKPQINIRKTYNGFSNNTELVKITTYFCDFCNFKSTGSKDIKIHIRETHGYICGFEGCPSIFIHRDDMIKHKNEHPDYVPYKCDVVDCSFQSDRKSTVDYHVLRHLGIKQFECPFGGCEDSFVRNSDLKSHAKTHSLERQASRRKEEAIIIKLLKEWGFSVDMELTINAKRKGCVSDTPDRHFSRIDFNIINCTNVILLLEVDENQHMWYELGCELSIMSDVESAITQYLTKDGHDPLPIYWIRYNPNGKYTIDGKKQIYDKTIRESCLKKHLEYLCSEEFVPSKKLYVHYMFYDLISIEEGPEIFLEDDFPEIKKQFCSWNKIE